MTGNISQNRFLGQIKVATIKEKRTSCSEFDHTSIGSCLGLQIHSSEKNETVKVHFASLEKVEEQKIIWKGSAKFLLSQTYI